MSIACDIITILFKAVHNPCHSPSFLVRFPLHVPHNAGCEIALFNAIPNIKQPCSSSFLKAGR
jgi:hypothetical protein